MLPSARPDASSACEREREGFKVLKRPGCKKGFKIFGFIGF